MPELLLGPILRHVGEEDATVWVETDVACEVEVLGSKQQTFCVRGHHYALVCVDGLEPKTRTEYDVKLDGEVHWPEPASELPPPVINALDPQRPLRILFGSCRVALPHEPPFTLDKDEDERGRGHDALWVLAQEMLADADHHWPDLLMLLGDQVYADEVSPETLEYIRRTRGTDRPPGEEVANYEEYTRLYRESWSDPLIRWLLSTVPSAMVIDDHDMHDDWNISESWVEDAENLDWWEDRVLGGLVSYWVYQHLGNLSPRTLEENDLYTRVREADDGYEELRQFAASDERRHEGVRWSYTRELGSSKLIVLDDRTGRMLREGERRIIDPETWEWAAAEAQSECEHLVIGVSDPAFMSPALSDVESWGEAVCEGRWGKLAARLGEKLRRGVDFDHWPAFRRSFRALAELLAEVGSRTEAPASITLLSGDVHHAYLAEVGFPGPANVKSAVHQAVCSPFRNELDERERNVIRLSLKRPAMAFARRLARAAGVEAPPVEWSFVEGPYFDNQAGTLVLDGPKATVVLDKTVADPERPGGARLERLFERELTPG
jgi:PhoD-like phosphatase